MKHFGIIWGDLLSLELRSCICCRESRCVFQMKRLAFLANDVFLPRSLSLGDGDDRIADPKWLRRGK